MKTHQKSKKGYPSLSRRKKSKKNASKPIPAVSEKKAPSMIALWRRKTRADGLFPGFTVWALILHVIFFGTLFFVSKSMITLHPQPEVRDIEFRLSKDKSKFKPKKVKKVSETKSAGQNTPKQEQARAFEPSYSQKPSSRVQSSSPAHSPAHSSNDDVSELSDNDLIPFSGIKRSSSGISGSGRTYAGVSSGEVGSGGGGAASSSSSQGKSQGSGGVVAFDITPYINELRRNIRMNWRVPKNVPNKRVELFLRIAKDGRVTILNVKRTSEVAALDDSTLEAVRRSTPLRALPAKYTKNYLDVVFVFNPLDGSVR